MINAWSLLGSVLDGTLDEEYPIMDKTKGRWSEEDEIREMDDYPLREDVNPYEYYSQTGNIDLTVDNNVVCNCLFFFAIVYILCYKRQESIFS